jgi:hypothetical protein
VWACIERAEKPFIHCAKGAGGCGTGRVDYINGLHKEFGGDAAEEVREQLKAAVEECRAALRNRAEEEMPCPFWWLLADSG